MGVKCSCKANQPGPDLLLGTEAERRTVQRDLYAPVYFKSVNTVGDDDDEGYGLIKVQDLNSGHLRHQRIGLDGITTRPRMASGVLDAFKMLFVKESCWVGKLKFSLEEGLSDEIVLEYKVTGFTKKGDVKGERVVRKKLPGPAESSPLYDITTHPCKIMFDTFFPTGEDPVLIFKCEDDEIVLLVDTRIKLVNNGFDVTGRYVEGIGYRKRDRESKSFDPDDSSSSSDSEPRPSFDGIGLRQTVSTEANTVLRTILDSRHRSRSVEIQEHKSGASDFEEDDEKAHSIEPPSPDLSRRPSSRETPYEQSGEFYLQRVVAPPHNEEDPLEDRPSDYLGSALERLSTAYLASPYKKSPLHQQKQEPLSEFPEIKEELSEEDPDQPLRRRWSSSDRPFRRRSSSNREPSPSPRDRPRRDASVASSRSSPQQQQLDPGRQSMASISLVKEDDDFQPGSGPQKPDIRLRLLCEFKEPLDEQKPPDPSEEKRAAFESFMVESRGGPGYAKLPDHRISI